MRGLSGPFPVGITPTNWLSSRRSASARWALSSGGVDNNFQWSFRAASLAASSRRRYWCRASNCSSRAFTTSPPATWTLNCGFVCSSVAASQVAIFEAAVASSFPLGSSLILSSPGFPSPA